MGIGHRELLHGDVQQKLQVNVHFDKLADKRRTCVAMMAERVFAVMGRPVDLFKANLDGRGFHEKGVTHFLRWTPHRTD